MKVIKNKMRIIAGLFLLTGVIIGVWTNNYNKTHTAHPNEYGIWMAETLPLIGMFFLMPWKEKDT